MAYRLLINEPGMRESADNLLCHHRHGRTDILLNIPIHMR